MVTYLLFPLPNLIGMNVHITKGIIQKVGTVFIVSPKESGLVFFLKLLFVMGMVSALSHELQILLYNPQMYQFPFLHHFVRYNN